MGRHKMKTGTCHLCGTYGNLSFEHVPPQTAFNKNTKYTTAKFDDYAKLQNPLNERPKGKTKQGGIGENSFCEKCNNFLGQTYVPAYKRWVLAGREIIMDTELYFHKYIVHKIEPQKIVKQIISMFLAINKEWFFKGYYELSEFVNDSTELLEKYNIFFYLTQAENIRYSPFMICGNFSSGNTFKCSEIAFPPYGYVLTIDSPKEISILTNITSFKSYEGEVDLKFNTFQLPTHLAFPLDYRTKEEIENENRIKAK